MTLSLLLCVGYADDPQTSVVVLVSLDLHEHHSALFLLVFAMNAD